MKPCQRAVAMPSATWDQPRASQGESGSAAASLATTSAGSRRVEHEKQCSIRNVRTFRRRSLTPVFDSMRSLVDSGHPETWFYATVGAVSERFDRGGCSRPTLASVGPLGEAVSRRVAHRRGVTVVEDGRLARPDGGHPVGTGYVVIEARTLLDCEHAETALGDLGGLPDLAWEYGWEEATGSSEESRFRLRIFPAGLLSGMA